MSQRLTLFASTIIALAICTDGSQPASADWPQFGGPSGDFCVKSQDGNYQSAAKGWSKSIGLGDAAPVVVADRIYFSEASVSLDGTESLTFHCSRLEDGQSIWSRQLKEQSFLSQDISDKFPVRPMACPVVANGHVVSISYGGIVACMDASDGKLVWEHNLVTDFGAEPLQFGWSTSPWSDGKIVVVACGGEQGILMAFELATGKVAWTAGKGAAAYGSIAWCSDPGKSTRLCYISQNDILVVNADTGTLVLSEPLVSPGLTNAVTPIWLDNSDLLVAGQGFQETRRVSMPSDGVSSLQSSWSTKQLIPFYCNWLADKRSQSLIAYNSGVLRCVDMVNGQLKWKSRGWIDANFACWDDRIVGVRGDGFIGIATFSEKGLEIERGAFAVADRVWAPPVIVGSTLVARGRKSITTVPLNLLPQRSSVPAGANIDSMDAMWGKRDSKITKFLDSAKEGSTKFTYDDYLQLVNDPSVNFAEREYQELIESLSAIPSKSSIAKQIILDWQTRKPESILAFDAYQLWITKNLSGDQSEEIERVQDRMTTIHFDVTVPRDTPPDARVFLTGNALALGGWKTAGFEMRRTSEDHYHASVQIPKGELEFKVTLGEMDKCEVRLDSRNISNRRRTIRESTTIHATVERWKSL